VPPKPCEYEPARCRAGAYVEGVGTRSKLFAEPTRHNVWVFSSSPRPFQLAQCALTCELGGQRFPCFFPSTKFLSFHCRYSGILFGSSELLHNPFDRLH
jgi:hypothetical protein